MAILQGDETVIVSLTQVLDRLDENLPAIAGEVFARVWAIPGYDDEHLPSSDLACYVRPNLHDVIGSLRVGSDEPALTALAAARHIGESRALQGVPIDAVIQSWSTAERVLRDHLLTLAEPLAVPEVHGCIRRLSALFLSLTRLSVDSYRKTQDEVTTHYDRLTTDLLARLTGDQPADPGEIRRRARSIGIEPTATYAAIVIALRRPTGLPEPQAYLRIQRHLLATVGARASGRVLVGTMDEFPLLLVPCTGGVDALAAQLEYALERASGPESVTVGLSADLAELASAGPVCQQAREALEVGRRLRCEGPIVRFSDVAADVLLVRNPDVAALLSARVKPLAARPELLETLRTYLECGLSARETARRMFVHPNTVPYRLKSIEQALGAPLTAVAADPRIVLGLRAVVLSPSA